MLLCQMCQETNPGTDALPHAEVWFRVYNLDCCTQNRVGSVCSPPWSLCRTMACETELFLLYPLLQSTRGKHGAWKIRVGSVLLLTPRLSGDCTPNTGTLQIHWNLGSPGQTWMSTKSVNAHTKYLLHSVPTHIDRSPIKTSCTKNTIDLFALEEIGIWLTVLIRDSWLQLKKIKKKSKRCQLHIQYYLLPPVIFIPHLLS